MIVSGLGNTREVATTIQPRHIQEKDRVDLTLQKYLQLRNRLENEEGQTLVEYGLLLMLIALVVMAAVALLGTQISDLFADMTAGFP